MRMPDHASASVLRVSQTAETPVTLHRRAGLSYRIAYERSADSQTSGEPGQDYLIIREAPERFVFALCDGVSQSFIGDLAARIVGEALVEWLWQERDAYADPEAVRRDLEGMLIEVSADATRQVRDAALPEQIAPMVRQVLEQKRANGSESTFAAGLVDMATGWLVLAWMGDSRIRVWGAAREQVSAEAFQTSERWSTRHGPIGTVHTAVVALDQVASLAIYSDGLALLDTYADVPGMPDHELDMLIATARAAPTSDDIAFLEIRDIQPPATADRWGGQLGPAEAQPAEQEHVDRSIIAPHRVSVRLALDRWQVEWQPVPDAHGYELEVRNGQSWRWPMSRSGSTLKAAQLPPGAHVLRVRAYVNGRPGRWSVWTEIPPLEPAHGAGTARIQPQAASAGRRRIWLVTGSMAAVAALALILLLLRPRFTDLRIAQDTSGPLVEASQGRLSYSYAYLRADPNRASSATGRGYLLIRADGTKLAFALYDAANGASAAPELPGQLSETIVTWLWDQPPPNEQQAVAALRQRIQERLGQGASQAAAPRQAGVGLAAQQPDGLPEHLAAGLIDTGADRLIVLQQGGARVKLLGKGDVPMNGMLTTIGSTRAYVGPAGQVQHVVAYSSAVAVLDTSGIPLPRTAGGWNRVFGALQPLSTADLSVLAFERR